MLKVRTGWLPPELVRNTFEEDLYIEAYGMRKPSEYKYTGYYWDKPFIPHYYKVVPKAEYQTYSFRKDPVPYTGKPRHRHLKGRKSMQYAREAMSYQEIPPRQGWKTRYFVYIDHWGYWDTKYTQYINQPKRDWKRTKVKKQYMKHKGYYGKTHKELNKEYLEDFPFCTVSLSKELYDRTSPRLQSLYGVCRFFPEDEEKFIPMESYDWLVTDDVVEFFCPKCDCYNKSKLPMYADLDYTPHCEQCHTYVELMEEEI